ncbi:hypothetical protein BASA81_012928 [Batrachochytrium salamandrivorans]|nr:hypothetical protein BASA81_012928 [Batrachochytrium salamandrivorans]
MDRHLTAQNIRAIVWAWKRTLVGVGVYLGMLRVIREYDLELAQLFLLLSCFGLLFGVIGFTPRQPGELSAYAHFNENGERLLGDMDPARAGRELTGQSMLDMAGGDGAYLAPARAAPQGRMLGTQQTDEDEDMQRAMLLSLKEARESRRTKHA